MDDMDEMDGMDTTPNPNPNLSLSPINRSSFTSFLCFIKETSAVLCVLCGQQAVKREGAIAA